jgi:hypothetical protein
MDACRYPAVSVFEKTRIENRDVVGSGGAEEDDPVHPSPPSSTSRNAIRARTTELRVERDKTILKARCGTRRVFIE